MDAVVPTAAEPERRKMKKRTRPTDFQSSRTSKELRVLLLSEHKNFCAGEQVRYFVWRVNRSFQHKLTDGVNCFVCER